jgi:hypothetical protein
MWDLCWTKWHWGRFALSISVSSVNFRSTNCSIFITWGWYNTIGPLVADTLSRLHLTSHCEFFSYSCIFPNA